MAQLHQIANDALSVPAGTADGSDRTNSVTVHLDANGLPQSIRLSGNWRDRISGANLSGAVMEASQQASAKRMNAWTQELNARGITNASQSSMQPESAPRFFESNPSHTENPRALNLIIEDALSRIDTLENKSAGPSVFRAEAAAGKVVVELDPRTLLSCHIEPDWADRQSDRTISAALADAIAKGRHAVTAANSGSRRDASPSGDGLQGLLGELLNFIHGSTERLS